MRIGVSGDVGSFSEEAGAQYVKKSGLVDAKLVHLIDMHGVLSALDNQQIDIGVFGVVNNNSGLVRPAFEAMGKFNFKIIDEIHLDVEQCLFAKQDVEFKDICSIYSYPPAFQQCKIFLQNKVSHLEQVVWNDMAKAARDLVNGVLPRCAAVIGSRRAAELYNLRVLEGNIQDIKPNITMFAVVVRLN